MLITANRNKATEIDDSVVRRVLNLYPEEDLENRSIFHEAFLNGTISFENLKKESNKMLIPWQMFLLTETNLEKQLAHIDTQRKHKVSPKLLAKRKGIGEVTSKRIIDRLIRQQNFLKSQSIIPQNPYCGALKGMHTQTAAKKILAYFDIDQTKLWLYSSKRNALQYLINQIELNNVNVSRGVLTNKLLPTWQVVSNDIYKNTSGFVIRDDCVPFIFLPNEINPDEVESRQIYTLIYLVAVIGLEQYDYFLSRNFKAKMLTAKGITKRLHNITTELLMPKKETDLLLGKNVTEDTRDKLAAKLKVSPTALITTLRIRGIISEVTFEGLKPSPYTAKRRITPMRPPKISTSVKKLCGQISYKAINTAIQNGTLSSIQAQYLIFGAVNKKGYKKYRNELGI